MSKRSKKSTKRERKVCLIDKAKKDLDSIGVQYHSNNGYVHIIIDDLGEFVDFWPTTKKFCIRSTGEIGKTDDIRSVLRTEPFICVSAEEFAEIIERAEVRAIANFEKNIAINKENKRRNLFKKKGKKLRVIERFESCRGPSIDAFAVRKKWFADRKDCY